MLKSMRSSAKSAPMKIFLVMLAIGFAMWGIDDVFRNVGSNDAAIKAGDYEKAISLAGELLKIDPSDSLAYLRLAIAVHSHHGANNSELMSMYGLSISEGSPMDQRLKSLANALLQAPKN